jgi:hypothetical protein
MIGLCESTVWGMASVFDRQIWAGAMPVSSATPFIPIFRPDVICPYPKLYRPMSKTPGVHIRVTFPQKSNSGK